jgi:hypothetical protein
MSDRTQLLNAGGGPGALEAALAVQRLAGGRFHVAPPSERDGFVHRPAAEAEPFGLATPERFSLPAAGHEPAPCLAHSELLSSTHPLS